MEKIVVAFSKKRQEQIFGNSMLQELSKIGNLTINESYEDPGEDDLMNLVSGAEILITSWGCPEVTARLLNKMPDLKMIVHAAGSIKGIISDEVWKRNIKVLHAACQLGSGVAETALGFTIASLKNFWNLREDTRKGLWDENLNEVRELYNIKIGVMGAGWAGKHYIELLKNFDVDILLNDPYVSKEEAKRLGVALVSFEQLLKDSDVVSIHAPSIPETYHMFSKERLNLMKKDAVLINTARGSIIDEKALYEHMKKGYLSYACLDVTETEPPGADFKLRSLPNVIMTPHIAGLTNNGLQKIGRFVIEQIKNFKEQRECLGEVKAERLKIMA